MISPHVPGTKRLSMVTAALLADRTSEQARKLPALPEVKPRLELYIVTQVKYVSIRQVGTAYTGELRIELPASGIGTIRA
jgi:hypothetical protein